jgi:hypothetical protein
MQFENEALVAVYMSETILSKSNLRRSCGSLQMQAYSQ